ncbi:HPr family phosphocarrier protein [Methylonatrum kenyense]|uniref:HPr family phosphocarrier protein n=1 Tax=Methylonatrum kenyense TaxID=455253 RepID=UPI0020C1411A|nr:HPr family phosphocarrier protein [Methylonatrum kenyense]MCK8516251.1 HPr family phosphocarrier protein [Methylonatrum kenyense]
MSRDHHHHDSPETDGQLSEEVVICNRLGLHARAAARFVAVASRFEASIQVIREQRQVNGKSIMGVMMLAACKGTRLRLEAEGKDARQALDALCQLVEAGFDEQK